MTPTAILALVLLAMIVGLLVGHVVGERRGRDVQWIDDFIKRASKDAARRDARGRFKEAGK